MFTITNSLLSCDCQASPSVIRVVMVVSRVVAAPFSVDVTVCCCSHTPYTPLQHLPPSFQNKYTAFIDHQVFGLVKAFNELQTYEKCYLFIYLRVQQTTKQIFFVFCSDRDKATR